jgi:hypothetical protein
MASVTCPYCGQPAYRVSGLAVYPHRKDLSHKRFWLCEPCNAYVGCHPDGRPLGVLADAALRTVRSDAHAAFDPMWKHGRRTRSAAYRWLAGRLGLAAHECHIGGFDTATCERVIAVCESEVFR